MSSTLCKSSLLQDKQVCDHCNKYMQRICPLKIGCKLCSFIKSIYSLDWQYTQKVLTELNQWRICQKHLSPYQFYDQKTKCMWCAECTLEVIRDKNIQIEKKFEKFEKFDLVDKLTQIDQERLQQGFNYDSLNMVELCQHLQSITKELDIIQPQQIEKREEDQSLKEYKELVDNYCEQSNIIRFQSFYGHCQQNKINCVKIGFINQKYRQKMCENFQEQDFNKLIDKIKKKLR